MMPKNRFSFFRHPGYLFLMAGLFFISSTCYSTDYQFELTPFFDAMSKRQHDNALEMLQSRTPEEWGDDLPPMNRALRKGQRVLHHAAQFGQTDLCLQIIRYGGLVNQKDNFGNTPLHLAAKYGHSETISVLALKGATVDSPNGRGMTPLHFATQYTNVEAIKSLIRLGADPETQNDEGKTCFDLADTEEARAALETYASGGKKSNKEKQLLLLWEEVQDDWRFYPSDLETVEEWLSDTELSTRAKKQKLIDLMIKRSIPVP